MLLEDLHNTLSKVSIFGFLSANEQQNMSADGYL